MRKGPTKGGEGRAGGWREGPGNAAIPQGGTRVALRASITRARISKSAPFNGARVQSCRGRQVTKKYRSESTRRRECDVRPAYKPRSHNTTLRPPEMLAGGAHIAFLLGVCDRGLPGHLVYAAAFAARNQNCLGMPACFRTAFAVWRDTMARSTGKRRPVMGLYQIS